VISIEPGGVFNGNCEMKAQPDKSAKPAFFVKNQTQIEKSSAK
jgi:cytoskeletal protein CcmA (bactofilin family)